MVAIHDFRRQLRESESPDGDRRTERILREYFGSPADFLVDWSPRRKPFGADLRVRAHGDWYTLDEKRRSVDRRDELLEVVSNDRTSRAGWAVHASRFDYVLFTYPRGRWELVPGPALEAALRENVVVWTQVYGVRRARNARYNTLSIPVGTYVLRQALARHGAAPCLNCKRPVGRFGVTCDRCGRRSCCAVGGAEGWTCGDCAAREGGGE